MTSPSSSTREYGATTTTPAPAPAVDAAAFPRNRLIPPLLEGPTWCLSRERQLLARVVRIAPKQSLVPPHRDIVSVKLLRGETNEIPTPLAAAKACRSCMCPAYVPAVKAGAEGAIVLLTWRAARDDCGSDGNGNNKNNRNITTEEQDKKDLEAATDVPFSPSRYHSSSPPSAPIWEESADIPVTEASNLIAHLRFLRGGPGATSPLITHKDAPIPFGEVGIVVDGSLLMEYDRTSGAGQAEHRSLKVPCNYEWGPFYEVDECGHTHTETSGHLHYTPHQLIVPPSDEPSSSSSDDNSSASSSSSTTPLTIVASVRLPIKKSELAGPHRNCYT